MIPWWERVMLFLGAFVFVLVWIVRNIDYDNLVKWRGIVRRTEANWTWPAILGFLLLVGIAAYSVYWFIIHKLN